MVIHEHLLEFAGKPVVTDRQGKDPSAVAWYIGIDPSEYWGPNRAKQLPVPELVEAFAEGPYAASASAIVIGPWSLEGEDAAPVVEALVSAAPRLPSLRAIFLGDIVVEEQEISWIAQSDVTPILEAYPELEILRVRGSEGLAFRPTTHAKLRELAFETGGLPAEVVTSICASKLPALEHLELWLGGFDYQRSTELSHLAPLLSRDLFPKLRYLGLKNARDADAIAAAVADSKIMGQLRVLDLSMGTLGYDGAEALLASPHVAKLEKLILAHHYLADVTQARLRALKIEVDLSDPQGEAGEDERYHAVSE
jgi:hypothetical protein